MTKEAADDYKTEITIYLTMLYIIVIDITVCGYLGLVTTDC